MIAPEPGADSAGASALVEFEHALDLPVRLANELKRKGCATVQDVRWWLTPQHDLSEPGDFTVIRKGDGDAYDGFVIHARDLRYIGSGTVRAGIAALDEYDRRTARGGADE